MQKHKRTTKPFQIGQNQRGLPCFRQAHIGVGVNPDRPRGLAFGRTRDHTGGSQRAESFYLAKPLNINATVAARASRDWQSARRNLEVSDNVDEDAPQFAPARLHNVLEER